MALKTIISQTIRHNHRSIVPYQLDKGEGWSEGKVVVVAAEDLFFGVAVGGGQVDFGMAL